MTILQPAQEEKQQRRLDEKLAGNKYQDEIEDVFHRILRNSKRIQARKLFPYNIVLIGFMGAGKSAISDFLSTMFDMRLVEMDQEISERQEMSIPDICRERMRDLMRRRCGAAGRECGGDEEERPGRPSDCKPRDDL